MNLEEVIKVFNSVTEIKMAHGKVHDKPGVYVVTISPFYLQNKSYNEIIHYTETAYVGRSNNLSKRLNNHPVIKVLEAFFIVNVYYQLSVHNKSLERLLINALNPKVNRI